MIPRWSRLAAAVLAALLFAPAALASIPSAADLALAPPALPELKPASIEATTEPESCGVFCQRLEVRLEAGLFGGGEPSVVALDAWGNYRNPEELEASKNRFGFTGHLFDRETGTYYAKARYFDPELGRFLSQDSYLGEIDNPPSIHRYTWAHNRPTYYVDPTGNVVETAWDVFSLGLGLKSLRDSLSEGRIADAALDTLGIVADTAAVIVPGVPGGFGAAIRGGRGGKKLVDTLQAVDAAANATQAAGAAVDAIHEGKGGRALLNAGLAAVGAGGATRSTRRVAEEASDVGADANRAARGGPKEIASSNGAAPRTATQVPSSTPITDPRRLLAAGPTPGEKGREFQAAVHQALRLPENTVKFQGVSRKGTLVNTEPDLIGFRTGVTDIKDVAKISFDQQLQAQYSIARRSQIPFNLIISPKTRIISVQTQQAVRSRGGIIVEFDATSGSFRAVRLRGNRVTR